MGTEAFLTTFAPLLKPTTTDVKATLLFFYKDAVQNPDTLSEGGTIHRVQTC
jgi:hypothetical protein